MHASIQYDCGSYVSKQQRELTAICWSRREQNTCGISSPVVVSSATAVEDPIDSVIVSSPIETEEQNELIFALRRRIIELEGHVQHNVVSPPAPISSTTSRTVFARDESTAISSKRTQKLASLDTPYDPVVEDAASIHEFLAWGRRKNPEYVTIASPEDVVSALGIGDVRDTIIEESHSNDSIGLDEVPEIAVLQLLLPEKRRVWELVSWHEQCLLWYHCTYYAPTFRKQLENFYNGYGGSLKHPEVSLQWVAFLFAILAGSMTCMPDCTAEQIGYSTDEREILSRRWFQAVITCLNKSDYAANHSILSVQAIATLTVSAHMLGFSNLHSIHLAAATRIAQGLGLHKLTSDAPGSDIEKETGRRVWSQLCSQDWFSLPFSETYLINPLYSRSELPRNCHDNEVVLQPNSTPTVTGYSRFLYWIASIMPRLQDGLMSCNTPFTKYEQVIKWDKQLRSLATSGRPPYLASVPLNPSWPVFIPWARRALAISSSHKIIMIHRSFLSESFTNPAFAFTRRTCLAAAKTILKEYRCAVEEDGPVLWIHQAFSVAASIILILDALNRDSNASEVLEHLRLVESILDILKQCRNSIFAVRGTKLISALLRETTATTTDALKPSGRKRLAVDDWEGQEHRTHKRMRGFNVSQFVKSFCIRQNSATKPPEQGGVVTSQCTPTPSDLF